MVPFSLELQSVQRLFIVDLLDHPVVATVEIQQLRDRNGDSGLRMLRMRHDGYVDVLTQDTLADLPLSAGIGRGRGIVATVPFRQARFDTTTGLGLAVELSDPDGVDWLVSVESDPPPRGRGPFLAPVGSDVNHPDRFFAVEMLDFAMLTDAGSRVVIEADGRRFGVVRLPRLVTVRSTLLARWAPTVVAADLMAGSCPPVAVVPATAGSHPSPCGTVTVGPDSRALSVSVGNGSRTASLILPTGLPPLDRLAQGRSVDVPWLLEVAGDRVVSGRLALDRNGDTVRLALVPDTGWTPTRPTLLVRAITTMQPVMRRWPTTYRWDAELSLGERPVFRSAAWSRVDQQRTPGHLDPRSGEEGLAHELALGDAGRHSPQA